MLPAIGEAITELRAGWKERFGGDMTRLDIEQKAGGVGVEWYARNGFNKLYELHTSGGPSWSGESVTEATAANLSTVWACRRIISEAAGMVPLDMMRKTKAGKFPADGVDAPLHPMYTALKHCPNDEMSSMVYREAETGNLLMAGNGYSQIIRRSGTGVAVELQPLLPSQIKLDRDSEKRRVYIVNPDQPGAKTFTVEKDKPHDILHIIGPSTTGREGQGVVAQARNSWGAAISADRYAARYFAKGGRQPGFLKLDKKFATPQDEDKFVADLDRTMDGPNAFHKWPIFPPGIDFKTWGWTPQESQFLESREFNVPEICRWFLISPDLVGDMSKATLNNMEQLALRFVKMTLTAWLVRWEQDLWRCLLTPEEKGQGYYFRHNVNGLLRGDYLTRIQGYASGLQNGFYSQNEVRDLEDLNGFEGGDDYHIQLNMQTLPGGTPTASQSASLQKIGSAKKGRIPA